MAKVTRDLHSHDHPLSLDLLEMVNDLSDAERHVLGTFVLLFPTYRTYHNGVLTELGWLKQIRATLDTLQTRIFIHEINATEREVLAGWIASTDRRINALVAEFRSPPRYGTHTVLPES